GMSMTDNPIAVVTGAGRGLGEAISVKLHADGYHVVAIDLHRESVVALADRLGARAEAHVIDVSDRLAVHALFADLDRRVNRVDAVVNNAMVLRSANIVDMTDELLDLKFSVGVKATYWTMQAAQPI